MTTIENINGFRRIGCDWRSAPVSHKFIRRATRKVHKFAPVLDAHARAIDINPFYKPGISRLLARKSPAAIAGFIISIIINAINGMAQGRPAAHVRKKCLETISPAFANLDAPSSPSCIARVIGIVAAKFHLCPDTMLGTLTEIMSPLISISRQEPTGGLFRKAAATECRSPDIGRCSHSKISTIASTAPHGVTRAFNALPLHDEQSTEKFSFEVESVRHRNIHLNTVGQYRKMG